MPDAAGELQAEAGTSSETRAGAATESVERPEPGLARGLWEAPPSVFYAVAAATLIGGAAVSVLTFRRGRR